jgi:hypothetical protein
MMDNVVVEGLTALFAWSRTPVREFSRTSSMVQYLLFSATDLHDIL